MTKHVSCHQLTFQPNNDGRYQLGNVAFKSDTNLRVDETTTMSSMPRVDLPKMEITDNFTCMDVRQTLGTNTTAPREDWNNMRASLSTMNTLCHRCGVAIQDSVSTTSQKLGSQVSVLKCYNDASSNKFNHDKCCFSDSKSSKSLCCKYKTSHRDNITRHSQTNYQWNAETPNKISSTTEAAVDALNNIINMQEFSNTDNRTGCTSTAESKVNRTNTKNFTTSRHDTTPFCKPKKFSKRFQSKVSKTRKSRQNLKHQSRVNSKTSNLQFGKTTSNDSGLFRNLFGWIIILFSRFLNAGRIFTGTITSRNQNGLASRCIVFAMWALIVLPGDTKRVLGNTLLVTPNQFCTRTKFMNSRQHDICHNHSDILKYVEEGVLLGSHRCQREFQYNRWNCSRLPKTYYSRLLHQDLRETAYVTAVTSAAVTYSLTYACSKGEIPNCGCIESAISSYDLLKQEANKRNLNVEDEKIRQVAETFEWGGCADNVEYGEIISRLFTENFGRMFRNSDLKAKIERHNLEAGRLAISKHMRSKCQCHGLTGACTFKTCWDTMPKWQDVGARLRNRFNNAVRVQLANDGRALLPSKRQRPIIKEYPFPRTPHPRLSLNRRIRRSSLSVPSIHSTKGDTSSLSLITDARTASANGRRRKRKKRLKTLRQRRGNDRITTVDDELLVYSQESPNFCRRSRKVGSIGTTGRRCLPNTTGAGSCDYLCCGKTHSEHRITVTKDCNCRFEYCCKMVCDKCTTEETVHTCD